MTSEQAKVWADLRRRLFNQEYSKLRHSHRRSDHARLRRLEAEAVQAEREYERIAGQEADNARGNP